MKYTWEELVTIGQQVREKKDTSQWDLGDISLTVETQYGEDSLGKFAYAINVNKATLLQYRKVADVFPKDKRLTALSHRHHLKAAYTDSPYEWITLAHDNNWSSDHLAREIKLANGGIVQKSNKLEFLDNGWRAGQTLFNFLEWLAKEKGFSNTQSARLADPFYIEDTQFFDFWREYQDRLQ